MKDWLLANKARLRKKTDSKDAPWNNLTRSALYKQNKKLKFGDQLSDSTFNSITSISE